MIATLPETNRYIALENGWLEDHPFLLGWPIFQVRTVSFREGIHVKKDLLDLLVNYSHWSLLRKLQTNKTSGFPEGLERRAEKKQKTTETNTWGLRIHPESLFMEEILHQEGTS